MIEAIILAAGKGTRMRSQLPKVMHPLAGKPLLGHVLDTARSLSPKTIHLVLGHGAEVVENQFKADDVHCVWQKQQLGTGHAVQQVLPSLADSGTALILYGDVPLITAATLERLLAQVTPTAMALLTVQLTNPTGYGRILRNQDHEVIGIVEQKDATTEQLVINEINTGVMAIGCEHLHTLLPLLTSNNAQGEYYLTDIVALANEQGIVINSCTAANEYEVMGINNRNQQAQLERHYQLRQAQALMEQGVTLMDPNRFDCRGSLVAGTDCVIDINCLIEGRVVLGNDVYIGPNCCIKNATIEDGSVIHANTLIEEAQVGSDCTIGPFARIRPGSVFSHGAKVGNFVETKQTKVGIGSKINHLSYIGDAELGDNVNIGAGTITCNYDGVNKSKTVIDDNVFVGSNSALVAPVTIASGATIAAGSTITQNVNENQLAVARQRQKNLDGWRRPSKK